MAAEELARVVRHLVDHPERVSVRELARGRHHLLELTVAPEDMGSVIGRQGRTAHALRALLRARGDAHGIRYDLEIREPEQAGEPEGGRRSPGRTNEADRSE